jgi:hypothetical protein
MKNQLFSRHFQAIFHAFARIKDSGTKKTPSEAEPGGVEMVSND